MKKMSVAAMALTLAVSLFSIADAGNRNGMDGGCGNCAQGGAGAPSDQFRKFQGDTIDLRQEMMIKRFEVQRENLKGTPDEAKIASLDADIKALQSKILDLRSRSGLPVDKCDGECGQMSGGFDRKGMGGCGKRMGGCNNGPCAPDGGRK
jgi:hypothetical protein